MNERERERGSEREKKTTNNNHKTILPIKKTYTTKNDGVTRYVRDDVCKFLEII